MRPAGILLACLLTAACAEGPVRTQSLYFAIDHAALFTDGAGHGAYTLELHSVRKVTELSLVRVRFERPGRRPWVRDITVRAGQRRFRVQTPPMEGFEPDGRYLIHVTLIAPDRFHRLDNLRHRVTPTVLGR